jgi:hypothetical protein
MVRAAVGAATINPDLLTVVERTPDECANYFRNSGYALT